MLRYTRFLLSDIESSTIGVSLSLKLSTAMGVALCSSLLASGWV